MISVAYRPLAVRDKRLIASYIALDLGQPQAAARTMRAIDDAIEGLKTIPAAGRLIDEPRLDGSGYRKLAVKSYWVVYRHIPESEAVVIERVLHQRMDIAPQMYYEVDYSLDDEAPL